jgi:7,8-dihydroneopterin aldolase/epimerase/oxygenase
MDNIVIADLEVFYRIGVTEAERTHPQRLLISLQLEHDFTAAIANDDLAGTIDYFAVSQRLLRFGDNGEWRLIETLANDIAELVLQEYRPASITVEIKKFVIPQARHVAVSLTRTRA